MTEVKSVLKPYRILVTGPRDFPDGIFVQKAVALAVAETRTGVPVVLVHGGCPTGVDHIADQWGRSMSELLGIEVEVHPAQNHPTQDFGPWPGAGPRRNEYMAGLGADICLAFIQPCTRVTCRVRFPHDSHGTASCIKFAEAAGIPVRKFSL